MGVFKDGMKLKMVYGPWSEVGQDQVCHVVGTQAPYQYTAAKSITVVMIPDHGALVPWAEVVKPDGRIIMVNLLLMEEVEIATGTPEVVVGEEPKAAKE